MRTMMQRCYRGRRGLGVSRCLATLLALAVVLVTIGAAAAEPAPRNGGTVAIGIASALSDPLADLGWHMVNGAQLAVNQVNAAGGLRVGALTLTVTLVVEDSACDATAGAAAANALVAAGCVGVIGPLCSRSAAAGQPIYETAGVPLVLSSATRNDLTEQGYQTTFRVAGRDDDGPKALAKALVQARSITRIGILSFAGWGADTAPLVSAQFIAAGGQVIREQTVDSIDDLNAALAAMQTAGAPAVVYVDDDLSRAAEFARLAAGPGFEQAAWYTPETDQALVPKEGTINWPAGFIVGCQLTKWVDMPGAAKLQTDYQAAGFAQAGAYPDTLTALAYDATGMLLAAIQEAGSTDRAAVRQALDDMTSYTGVGGAYRGFDEQGELLPALHWPWVRQYLAGSWVGVYPRLNFVPLIRR